MREEFENWFYSVPYREKYGPDDTAYITAFESWLFLKYLHDEKDIQDRNEKVKTHRYLFTWIPTLNQLDSLYEINDIPDVDDVTLKVALQFDNKIGNETMNYLRFQAFRTRFAMSDGPFLVSSEMELDFDTLEAYINRLGERDKENFFENANLGVKKCAVLLKNH